MSAALAPPEPSYGTRWIRTCLLAVLGLAALAAMVGASTAKVLGFNAQLTVMNAGVGDANAMSISTSRLQAVQAAFGMAPERTQSGTWRNVLRAGFAKASVSGLCISRTESIPILGTYTITLTSTGTITANNGVLDITDIVGDASGTGINLQGSTQIGLVTPDLTTVYANGTGLPYQADPLGETTSSSGDPMDVYDSSLYNFAAPGAWPIDGKPHIFGSGWTGINAGAADLVKVAGRLEQAQLTGNITLPKMQISVQAGSHVCASWPTNAPYTNANPFP